MRTCSAVRSKWVVCNFLHSKAQQLHVRKQFEDHEKKKIKSNARFWTREVHVWLTEWVVYGVHQSGTANCLAFTSRKFTVCPASLSFQHWLVECHADCVPGPVTIFKTYNLEILEENDTEGACVTVLPNYRCTDKWWTAALLTSELVTNHSKSCTAQNRTLHRICFTRHICNQKPQNTFWRNFLVSVKSDSLLTLFLGSAFLFVVAKKTPDSAAHVDLTRLLLFSSGVALYFSASHPHANFYYYFFFRLPLLQTGSLEN